MENAFVAIELTADKENGPFVVTPSDAAPFGFAQGKLDSVHRPIFLPPSERGFANPRKTRKCVIFVRFLFG